MPVSSWTMPEVSGEHRGRVEEELRRRDLPPRTRERLEMVKAAALPGPAAGGNRPVERALAEDDPVLA